MTQHATRPVLIYDGDCGFCKLWVQYWSELTKDAIEYQPLQHALGRFVGLTREELERAVHLVHPDGRVWAGAAAVYQLLAQGGTSRWPALLYERVPGFAGLSERAYALIAAHRPSFYRLTVALWGKELRPPRYQVVCQLFLRLLGLIWLLAFASFALQARALIGEHGILPVTEYFARLGDYLGWQAWWRAPSLFWLSASDSVVLAACLAGCGAGALLVVGRLLKPALALAFVLYLSIVNGGQEFLSYQWDALLLEAGLLGFFLGWANSAVWLFRWLLFRLYFLSGAVKLLSGDPSWRNGTALLAHFETQPLPNPVSWYVHQLPEPLLRLACAATLATELVAPWLIFAPRRLRLAAAVPLAGLQVAILLTGNYAFFNYLTLALCLFLLDDAALGSILGRCSQWFNRPVGRPRPRVARAASAILFLAGLLTFSQTLGVPMPAQASELVTQLGAWGISSGYGLFAVMTTMRPEIIVEGSNDGEDWRAYEFRYKPGQVHRPPPWVAPHQPRLDWQMWFAALGSYQDNPWFLRFVGRLLEGDPRVLGLLEADPFNGRPPRWIRAVVYRYRFTRLGSSSRGWWEREFLGIYLRPVQQKTAGAGDGIRTRDINLGKVALYQLSYSRSAIPLYDCPGAECQLGTYSGE